MAIESAEKIEGFSRPIPGIYSRLTGFVVRFAEPGGLEDNPTRQIVQLEFAQFADKDAAARVMDERAFYEAGAYDANNPAHVAQWQAYIGAPVAEDAPPVPQDPLALDMDGNLLWAPSVERIEQFWGGKTAEPCLGTKSVVLQGELAAKALDLALAEAGPDALRKGLYALAEESGKFAQAKGA